MNLIKPIKSEHGFVRNFKPNCSQSSLKDWVKIKDLVSQNPHLITLPQMRWLLNKRQLNGLDAHTRKIGKYLYIYVPGFIYWIEHNCER